MIKNCYRRLHKRLDDLQVCATDSDRDYTHYNSAFRINLTAPVTVTLPMFNATGVYSNQTFVLPPFQALFKSSTGEFQGDQTITLRGYPSASNYSIVRTGEQTFAASQFIIPQWNSNWFFDQTGQVYWNVVDMAVPPK